MTLAEAVPKLDPPSEDPIVIHLVAYERSSSAPNPLSTGTSKRMHTGAPLPGTEGLRNRQTSRQSSTTPVQESSHRGGGNGARRATQPNQRVVCFSGFLIQDFA